jgi:type II secretory pathway pseudopilin PulG
MSIALSNTHMIVQRMLDAASNGVNAPRRASMFGRRGSAGIALAEVLVGIAIITIISATSMWALGASNRLAAVNRNYTGAKALLQNSIDQVLSVNYPVSSVPAILNAGTTTTAVTINPGPPAVTGTMTTTVSVTDATLNIRQVKVTVAYPYNGRVHSVSMSTARSPD